MVFTAPSATVNGKAKAGYVAVVYGSANGLKTASKQVFDQDSPGIPGAAEASDAFGTSVSVADVNGGGHGDISADVSGDVSGESPGTISRTRSAVVMRGSVTGPIGTGSQVFHQGTPGVGGAAETGDRFGLATRLVDTDRDGRAELIAGAPGENAGAGSVRVLPGTTAGIAATGSRTFGAGTLGTVATGAALGSSFHRRPPTGENGAPPQGMRDGAPLLKNYFPRNPFAARMEG